MSARYHHGYYISENFSTNETSPADTVFDVSPPKEEKSLRRYDHLLIGGIGPLIEYPDGPYMEAQQVENFIREIRGEQDLEIADLELTHNETIKELKLCRKEDQDHYKKLLRLEKLDSNVALWGCFGLLGYILFSSAGII